MGKSRVVERYSVSFALPVSGHGDGDAVVYNDASVNAFVMNIPLDSLPYGTANIVGSSGSTANPISGTYGKMIITGLGSSTKSFELPIYVVSAVRTEISQDSDSIALSFLLGDNALHGVMEPVAINGTSVEAMAKLFSIVGAEVIDEVSPAKGNGGVSDNMTWRFVEGSISDHLDGVVEHASIPGDILFWAFDDSRMGFRIGTFNVSKAAKKKHFFMFTTDSVTTTDSAMQQLKGSDTGIWYYSGYLPSDHAGETREPRSPNLVIDSTASGTTKDTGVCNNECWQAVLSSMGASQEYFEDSAYGQQFVVKPFPSNTHKTYAIAPFVRSFMLSEYSKTVRLKIYNHPGPPVGSCVHFYAASPRVKSGDFLPDENYTAKYIVVGKTITKNATVGTGMLGKARMATTTDMVTELVMVSNAGYSGAEGAEFKAVMSVADAMTQDIRNSEKK